MGEKSSATHWRDYIPPTDTARSKELANSNTYQWAAARCAEPFLADWTETWRKLDREPYKGITVDGTVIPHLFRLAENEDESVEAAAMLQAAQTVLEAATPAERHSLSKDIDSPEWRQWLNPEIYIHRHGVRLEEVSAELVSAIHGVMRASLSPAGYAKASGCMKVNGFLGEVVHGTQVLNERSYNFTLFGLPSRSAPWGWQLFGHHLAINCLTLGTQTVLTPIFMGAEPNLIDAGPHAGLTLFAAQEHTALTLIRSLDPATLRRVRIYTQLHGAEYPPGRFHRADQRTLGGAFQDNRTITHEGALATSLTDAQQERLRALIALSIEHLPPRALAAKLAEIAAHWAATRFCWIGGVERGEGFYYKVHSPVVMIEFDHHSGVFLENKKALPFHVHTIVRTPNGNDYGKELLRLYRLRGGEVGG